MNRNRPGFDSHHKRYIICVFFYFILFYFITYLDMNGLFYLYNTILFEIYIKKKKKKKGRKGRLTI